MTTATVTNNKFPRKQLSDQLDRLDGILDALSEGLNGAVADAAQEGTRLAVKDAIVEIMTDPTLRARFREAAGPDSVSEPAPPIKKPSFWARWKAKAAQAAAAVGHAAARLVSSAAAATARGGRRSRLRDPRVDPGAQTRGAGSMPTQTGLVSGVALPARP